jgi:phenylalanyl-tRNA synthetase beta chain
VRVPLSWLRDYVDFDLPAERLAERLTLLGFEVQSIDSIGADWRSVVVGELLEVAPHPRADRLSLTTVRVSDTDQPLFIVCGATNIAAGQRVPVALPGAVLPGDRRISVSTIQGAESQGMLCSGAELGLTTDADGIMILPPQSRLGAPLAELYGDTVLDIDVKPNRGDALSLIGLAREVAAIAGGEVRWPDITVPESGDATDEHVWVEVADRRLCPRFVARYADGVRVGPSPLNVQLRLNAAGMRPVSNVVDASNYVMLELGKPVHIFDAAAVSGGTIVVRPARDAEILETLDHVQRSLTSDTLVIADAGGPIGIAGVMGGAHSEVTDATTAVIIESAVFDPVSIRRTAQRLGLRSEASLRFEKGQESRLARLGADRTAQLLAEWAGARIAVGVTDSDPIDDESRRVTFRPRRIDKLLGAEMTGQEMVRELARVGIDSEPGPAEGELVAVVPPHRRDIAIEEDVAEEVIRLRGYESLSATLPDTVSPGYRSDPAEMVNAIRDALAGRGLSEVVTNALIGPQDHAALGFAADDAGTIRVENPVTVDHSELRRSLLPGLLAVLGRNERQRRSDVALFEVGNVHEMTPAGPEQCELLGMLLAGDWRGQSWAEPSRAASVEDLKGIIEAVASRLNVGRVFYRPAGQWPGVEHPGRTADMYLESDGLRVDLGRVGELHPRYVAGHDVRADHVAFAIIELAAVRRVAQRAPQVRSVHSLPSSERDIAVVVDRETPAADVEAAIRRNAGPFLARVELFDRYQGAPLESGQVSLAYRLRYQPVEVPLSEAQVETSIEDVVNGLQREVGGRVRSGG